MENEAPKIIEQGAPTAAVTVVGDVLCRTCGYNLRSLSLDSLCPECGARVEFSLRGNLLRFSDPQWLKHLSVGLGIQFFGLLTVTLSTIVFYSPFGKRFRSFFMSPTVVGSGFRAMTNRMSIGIFESIGIIVIAGGAWLATSREPAEDTASDTSTLRAVIRIGCTVFAIETMIQFIAMRMALSPPWYYALSVTEFFADLVNLAGIAAQMIWINGLGKRVPRLRKSRGLPVMLLVTYIGWKMSFELRSHLGSSLRPSVRNELANLIRMFGTVYFTCWVAYVTQVAAMAVMVGSQWAMALRYRRSVPTPAAPI